MLKAPLVSALETKPLLSTFAFNFNLRLYNGGYSDKMVVHERFAFHVPDDADLSKVRRCRLSEQAELN